MKTLILSFIAYFIIIFSLLAFSYQIYSDIRDYGLKNIVNEIWEGKEKAGKK